MRLATVAEGIPVEVIPSPAPLPTPSVRIEMPSQMSSPVYAEEPVASTSAVPAGPPQGQSVKQPPPSPASFIRIMSRDAGDLRNGRSSRSESPNMADEAKRMTLEEREAAYAAARERIFMEAAAENSQQPSKRQTSGRSKGGSTNLPVTIADPLPAYVIGPAATPVVGRQLRPSAPMLRRRLR